MSTVTAQGHTGVVNFLLGTDSNLAKNAWNNRKSLLHTAARIGYLEVVKPLLDKNKKIGFKTDTKGQTALHMAIEGQNVEIVRELIKPDPLYVEDNKRNTTLHIATRKGRNQVYKLPSLIVWSDWYSVQIQMLIYGTISLQMVQCLLSVEVTNVNSTNSARETPLDIIGKFGTPELVTLWRKREPFIPKIKGTPPPHFSKAAQTDGLWYQAWRPVPTPAGLSEEVQGTEHCKESEKL